VPALTSRRPLTRRLILQKARGQADGHPRMLALALPPSVSERFQVLFHSPHRGSFHLSLTVLVRYRSSRVFSLGRWSSLLPTGLACPVVLWLAGPRRSGFAYGTITRSGWPFQCHSAALLVACCRGHNPACRSRRFGLLRFRSPLLAECSLFLRVLRCFSSPGSLPPAYVFSWRWLWVPQPGFPIRISPVRSLHTTPRRFSQCATSFIGS
jgi:hypothetical protein